MQLGTKFTVRKMPEPAALIHQGSAPPIQKPFPVPPVGTVTVEKEYAHQNLGVSLVTCEGSRVMVSRVKPGSLCASSGLKIGQEILAVNGIAVHSGRGAVQVMSAFKTLQFTTLDVPLERKIVVQKDSTDQRIGVKLTKIREKVTITDITEDSLAYRSELAVGQQILAINNREVHSLKGALSALQEYATLQFTVLDYSEDTPKQEPFCYVEVAPTTKLNPGVSFDSCLNRTMVMISEIFVSDLSTTRLRKGDIVLAINGVAVWKPEDADREQLKAARDSKAVVLYCVDMEGLRDWMYKRVVEDYHDQMTRLCKASIQKESADRISIVHKRMWSPYTTSAEINRKTQLLEDRTKAVDQIVVTSGTGDSSATFSRNKEYELSIRLINAINDIITRQLNVLKQVVVSQAWHHSAGAESDPVYEVPSSPELHVPVEVDIAVAIADDEDIPTATAIVVIDG